MEQKVLRVGTVVILLAVLLRLAGNRYDLAQEAGNALVFMSTGRMVTQTQPTEASLPPETETAPQPEAVPVFGQEDMVSVSSSWEVDTLALLQSPLRWELRQAQPTVLILHTHATESFENTEGYTPSSPYRTLEEEYNMLSLGEAVAGLLEAAGIGVIHDRTLYDYPDFNSAYGNARAGMEQILRENPSICLVLDLHRDAAEDAQGNQVAETVTIQGQETAQLMLVMGSDKGSLSHAQWQKNLGLAVKLQAQLERDYPGLCRPVQLVTARYNQDLSTGALLVEIGSAGNTRDQALQAARFLAQGIIALANGANL